MIASENIVSPKVQEVITSDLHGRYAEGLPVSVTTKVVATLMTLSRLGSHWPNKCSTVISPTFSRLQEPYPILVH